VNCLVILIDAWVSAIGGIYQLGLTVEAPETAL
jgi:hypothetical protein